MNACRSRMHSLMSSTPIRCWSTSRISSALSKEIHRLLHPSGIMIAHVPLLPVELGCYRSNAYKAVHVEFASLLCSRNSRNENYRFSERSFARIQCYLDGDYPPGPLRFLFTRSHGAGLTGLKIPYYPSCILFSCWTFVLTK